MLRPEVRRAMMIQGGWTLAYVAVMIAAVYVAIGYPQLGNWRTPIMLLPLIPAFGPMSTDTSPVRATFAYRFRSATSPRSKSPFF